MLLATLTETGGITTEMFLSDDASRCSQSKHRCGKIDNGANFDAIIINKRPNMQNISVHR